MATVTVFHPLIKTMNQGHTEFSGPNVSYKVGSDGELYIERWKTATESGHATFARGQWQSVVISEKGDSP